MSICLLGPTAASVDITSARDIDRLRGVRCIYGSLHVETQDLVDLGGLEHIEVICASVVLENNLALIDTRGIEAAVGGGLRIVGNPVLERLNFPTLVDSGLILQDNPALTDLSGLDALTHSTFHVERCTGLTTLGPLPSLETGAFVSIDNPLLTAIDAPQLRVLDHFYSNGDHALAMLRLPALEEVDRLDVAGSDAFAGLDLPKLRRLRVLALQDNDAMTAVSVLPAIESLDIVVLADNDALVDLAGLEALPGADHVYIVHNAALDQAHAEAVGAALGGTTKIAGNAGWAPPLVCPFADGQCDAIGCEGLEVCAEGSDEIDCCECLGIECPIPPGGGS